MANGFEFETSSLFSCRILIILVVFTFLAANSYPFQSNTYSTYGHHSQGKAQTPFGTVIFD